MSLPELFGDRNVWGPKLLAFLRQSHDDDGDLLPEVVDTIRNGLAQQTDLTALGTTVSTHNANTGNPHAVTKTQVGLGNVDNTSDANKSVSTAQQTALDLKANQTALDTTNTTVSGHTTSLATHTTQIGYTNPGSALSVGQYVGGGTAGAPVKVNERVFDVTHPRFGAVGNGSTNDRAAIQAAIDAAVAAGGGTVWFPKGTYKVQITTATTVTSPSSSGQHALRIDGNNVTLDGAPGAVISCYAFGGDPDTNWEVVSGSVWRGGGIYISGGATWAARRKNVTIRNLEIDGNYTYTGTHGTASTVTGDGWDVTHKGIWFQNDTYHDGGTVQHCHVHNFAGELIYTGGADNGSQPLLGTFLVADSEVHDTNGSAISMGGKLVTVTRNHIYTAAGAGVENAGEDGLHLIFNNLIHNTLLDGVSVVGYGEGVGGFNVGPNVISNAGDFGVSAFSAWNTTIHHNTITDCTDGGVRLEVGSGYPNDTVRNVQITDNIIMADTTNMAAGVLLNLIASQAEGIVRVRRNIISRTPAAVAGAKIITEPLSCLSGTELKFFELAENSYVGTHGDNSAARGFHVVAPNGSQADVATYKPPVKALLRVEVTLQVTSAADVWLRIIHFDLDDLQVTDTLQNFDTLAVGTYTYRPYVFEQHARSTVYVRVQANATNAVYCSAIIREV